MRLLQVHFAVVVVTSGLHKLQFGDWWAGLASGIPLHPPFETDCRGASARWPRGERLPVLRSARRIPDAGLADRLPAVRLAAALAAGVARRGRARLGRLGLRLPAAAVRAGLSIGCLSYLTPAEWHGYRPGRDRGIAGLSAWLASSAETKSRGRRDARTIR